MSDHLTWTKLKQTEEKVGYRHIVHKTFRQPDGKIVDYTTVNNPDWAGVATIALTPDNQVVIARQYRAGPEAVCDEIPGGLAEEDEHDFAVAAARELLEETGYSSHELFEYIGVAYRDSNCNGANHYFLARNCTKTAEQNLDESEVIEVDTIPIGQLIANAKNGKMTDAAAVLMAYDTLLELQRSKT